MKILLFIIMSGLGFVLGLLINRIAKYIVDTKSDPSDKKFDLIASLLMLAWVIIALSFIPSIVAINSLSNHIDELERKINIIEENTQHNSADTLVITDIKIPN